MMIDHFDTLWREGDETAGNGPGRLPCRFIPTSWASPTGSGILSGR